MRAKMRAGGAPWRPSLKVARLEDDTGTSLDDHLPRAPVVSDWQRRDGGGATRVGRCGEGDSGSQRPLNRAPSADEMTASSRRTRWRHRRELATRACGAHGKFEGFASGEHVGTNLSTLEKKSDVRYVVNSRLGGWWVDGLGGWWVRWLG